jgi:hypothetical protein
LPVYKLHHCLSITWPHQQWFWLGQEITLQSKGANTRLHHMTGTPCGIQYIISLKVCSMRSVIQTSMEELHKKGTRLLEDHCSKKIHDSKYLMPTLLWGAEGTEVSVPSFPCHAVANWYACRHVWCTCAGPKPCRGCQKD